MLKKIILFCIVFAMLCPNCYAFSDIQDGELSDAVQILSDFGIINGYDDNTFRPDNKITRAEFAKIIISAANLYMPVSNPNSFSDTAGHWAKDYIDIAKETGIINGVSETRFAPDDNVTYEQAVKMIVAAIGYNDEAQSKGGYPDGYAEQARILGITEGINFDAKAYAARGNIALMINKALYADYYSIWNENGTIKRMETGKTLYQIHKDLAGINAYKDIPANNGGAVG